MINHDYGQDNDAGEPGDFWAGQQAGLLIGSPMGAAAFLMAKLIA
jgi:hypothetical protein